MWWICFALAGLENVFGTGNPGLRSHSLAPPWAIPLRPCRAEHRMDWITDAVDRSHRGDEVDETTVRRLRLVTSAATMAGTLFARADIVLHGR